MVDEPRDPNLELARWILADRRARLARARIYLELRSIRASLRELADAGHTGTFALYRLRRLLRVAAREHGIELVVGPLVKGRK